MQIEMKQPKEMKDRKKGLVLTETCRNVSLNAMKLL